MKTVSRLTVTGMSTKDGPTLGMLRRARDRTPRIVIVHDHPITLAGLNFLLAADCTVLARCADAHQALRCVRIYEPDVLIIDQDMPAMDGVDVLKQLRAAGDQTPVVLLATANNPKLTEALAFNVEGIVFKQSEPKCLLRCVRDVHAGRRWLDAKLNEAAALASGGDALAHTDAASDRGGARRCQRAEQQRAGAATWCLGRDDQESPACDLRAAAARGPTRAAPVPERNPGDLNAPFAMYWMARMKLTGS